MSKEKKISDFSLRLSKLLGSTIVGNAGGEGLGLYGKYVKNAGAYDLVSGKEASKIQSKLEELDNPVEQTVRTALKALALHHPNIKEYNQLYKQDLPKNLDATIQLSGNIILSKDFKFGNVKKHGIKIAIETQYFDIKTYSLNQESVDFDIYFRSTESKENQATFYLIDIFDPHNELEFISNEIYLWHPEKIKDYPPYYPVLIRDKTNSFIILSRGQAKSFGQLLSLAFITQPIRRYSDLFPIDNLIKALTALTKDQEVNLVDYLS
jgi:hypothetical protein